MPTAQEPMRSASTLALEENDPRHPSHEHATFVPSSMVNSTAFLVSGTPGQSALNITDAGRPETERQHSYPPYSAEPLPRLSQTTSRSRADMAKHHSDDKDSVEASGYTPAAVPGSDADHTLKKTPWLPKVTPWNDIIGETYPGSGTNDDPFVVSWLANDPENPLTFGNGFKAQATFTAAFSCLAVSMSSSMLSAAIIDIRKHYPGLSNELYIMVTSIFVLGFFLGPLVWAPLSEVLGRRGTFLCTFVPFTAFSCGVAGAPSFNAMLGFRFLAGTFGASAFTNAGGTISDMYTAKERGPKMGLFALAPFLGPAIGPVAGGFLSEAAGWRWVAGLAAAFVGVLTIIGVVFLPETYSIVILRSRAKRLSKYTGRQYRCAQDIKNPPKLTKLFGAQLKVPWILLFTEPIVFLTAIYMAIIYAILFMQFTSFPLVFQQQRGWSPGSGGLAFVGITVGAFLAVAYMGWNNKKYAAKLDEQGGWLAPEERLPMVIIGAIALPIGLFIFAWTSVPASIHWIVPILATVPFGFGLVLVFLGIMTYLIDAYLMYAASVMAANTVIRSAFGVVFPLFTLHIYDSLGINWAGTLIAFLTLLFAPAPILFLRYGRRIRRLTKRGREADDAGQMMREKVLSSRVTNGAAAQEKNGPESV